MHSVNGSKIPWMMLLANWIFYFVLLILQLVMKSFVCWPVSVLFFLGITMLGSSSAAFCWHGQELRQHQLPAAKKFIFITCPWKKMKRFYFPLCNYTLMSHPEMAIWVFRFILFVCLFSQWNISSESWDWSNWSVALAETSSVHHDAPTSLKKKHLIGCKVTICSLEQGGVIYIL